MDEPADTIQALLQATEGEHLEFKAAKKSFRFEELAKYAAALANAGGGSIVLGVTDKRPRQVVGTQAFGQPERTRRDLIDRLRLGVTFDLLLHPDGRVLVFHVPPRPVGMAVSHKGIYWMREGDSVVPMSQDRLRRIFEEAGRDFSAEVCQAASVTDLDPAAIEEFRQRWIAKSGNQNLANLPTEQLLCDAEALVDGRLTYAALVLLGTRGALARHLGQAEVVFEYRSSDASGPAQQRIEFRQGFFGFYDGLWEAINLRNDVQHYQEGLFVFDVDTFSERCVREAILNAVSHRDYQLAGSVFVRQYSRRIEIVSPGGLPVGITLGNILDRQSPRNRRIANLFAKCGLVERSGQGMNLIFEDCIRESKPTPDFAGTDQYQVAIALHGTVENPEFLRFLEQVGKEKLASFSTRDWQVLGCLSRGHKIHEACKQRLNRLLDLGVIERVSREKFVLARRYYRLVGKAGEYTRKRGLDRETNKQLLLKHIRSAGDDGSPMRELIQVLPALSRGRVKALVQELARESLIHVSGRKRGARWYPGPATDDH